MEDLELMKQLTAQIVAAYVGGNTIASGGIGPLIGTVHAALVGLNGGTEPPAEALKPAVAVKKSVTPDALICLDCGKPFKMLKRHLHTDHNLSTAEYLAKWGLPGDYPVVAPNYAALRSELAKKIGLGRKAGPLKPRKKLGLSK